MKKIMALALFLTLAVPAGVLPVWADETGEAAPTNVGNKICPVSGLDVTGQDFATYHGKRYGLCCPMCEKRFLSEPDRYIKAVKAREPGLALDEDLKPTAFDADADANP